MADNVSVDSGNDDYVFVNSKPKLKIAKNGDINDLCQEMNEVLKDAGNSEGEGNERKNPFDDPLGANNPPADAIVDEGSTIFNGVTYLGAAVVNAPRSEPEINRNMEILNSQNQVSYSIILAVPSDSEGTVRLLDPGTNVEIASYRIHRILFCCRGPPNSNICNCFAFICSHGENQENTTYRCHVFRCNLQEAAGRILYNFALAFQKVPNALSKRQASTSEQIFNFNVSLEIKEDDGKGGFSTCPRDKNAFKLRCDLEKKLIINVTQMSNEELKIERCFGLLISPGRNVKHSDMHLIDMDDLPRKRSGGVIPHKMAIGDLLTVSMGATNEGKTYIISGQWDPTDPNFQILNTETHGDSKVFLTIAIDLVIVGIQEPVRFLLESKAKIYPTNERFWYITKKPLQETFVLKLKTNENEKGDTLFDVLSIESQTEIDRAANMSLKIQPNQIAIETVQTPMADGPEDDSGNDEPLMSGSGLVSKEITDDELLLNWQQVLVRWNQNLNQKPKQVTELVRKGVPEALRGEVWQRLSNCHLHTELLDAYRILITKDSSCEQVILRDINRTFPAHDFFKEAGGVGQDSLYRISKAYSVYDDEIGYCQGLSFLSAALLLHMPEEQAFCVLVQMMRSYGLREIYKAGFEALHTKFYQLERLVQDKLSDLYKHLKDLGIETHMYASQWFLTLFSAKFPLHMVFYVIDLILCDGLNMVFNIALALLKHSRKDLLALDFEGVLKYFRVNLPKNFRVEKNSESLMHSAVSYKVSTRKLRKYEEEYRRMKEFERQTENPIDRLEREVHQLNTEIFRLENENDLLAQELVTNKISLRKDLDDAENHCEELMAQVETTSKGLSEAREERDRLSSELKQLKEMFRRETEKSALEQKRNAVIITEYKQIISNMSKKQNSYEEDINKLQSQISRCESCSKIEASEDDEEKPTTGTRELELELAQTKLALVESECRTQDLTHQLNNALAELEAASKNSWLQKTLTSIKDATGQRKEEKTS